MTHPTHVLRISLQDDRSIYRELEIDGQKTLFVLAKSIVQAFDFEFDHAFGFYPVLHGRDVLRSSPRYEIFADMDGESGARSVKKTKVKDVFGKLGEKMLFLFDYGDDWRFEVVLIGFGEKAPTTRYPKLLKSQGVSPEQYPDWEEDED